MNARLKTYIAVFITAVFTHIYMFTNKFLNNDDVYYVTENSVQSNLGRWFLELVTKLTSKYSIPMVNGIMSMFCIVLAAWLICEIFEIQNCICEFLVGAIMVTFPVNASNNAYMFVAEGYGIGILLAVCYPYILLKKQYKKMIPAAVLGLMLSLATYQAYLCLAVGIFWIWLLRDTFVRLEKEKTEKNMAIVKTYFIKAFKYYAGVIVALVLYFITNNIVLRLCYIEIDSYQNLDRMGRITIYEGILGILKSYYRFLMFITGNLYGKTSYVLIILHISLIVLSCLVLYRLIIKKKGILNKGLLLLAGFEIILLPIMVESIEIIAANAQSRHIIMRFASVLWYIIPIVLLNDCEKICTGNEYKKAFLTVVAVLIFVNYFYCNLAYYKLDLTTQNVKMMLNRVVYAIESTDGYVPGETKVWLDFQDGGETSYISNEKRFEDISNLVGINNTYFIYYSSRIKSIMSNYLYFDYCEVDEESIELIKKTEQYRKMQAYPSQDSIKWINDILIVKLTD